MQPIAFLVMLYDAQKIESHLTNKEAPTVLCSVV